MNSNKRILLLIVAAIVGGAVFTLIADSSLPSISFLIGLLVSAFIFTLSTNPSEKETEQSASTKTLYVGNLPYKANESHVRDLFAEHGEVFAVRLMKDKRTGKRRGFGFVVMASSDVDDAIVALNDKDYMQRTLKVRIANDPKHPETGEPEQD